MNEGRQRIRRRMRRGVYLLPSSLTLGNLFCGFYALIAIYNDDYRTAALAIMLVAPVIRATPPSSVSKTCASMIARAAVR